MIICLPTLPKIFGKSRTKRPSPTIIRANSYVLGSCLHYGLGSQDMGTVRVAGRHNELEKGSSDRQNSKMIRSTIRNEIRGGNTSSPPDDKVKIEGGNAQLGGIIKTVTFEQVNVRISQTSLDESVMYV